MNEADEARIEQQLKQQGADAPRLSPEQIDQTIVDEAYYIFPNTTVTVCCLTLRNGFKVIGKSAAANTANFNEEIGRKVRTSKRTGTDLGTGGVFVEGAAS
jgi:formylmethanofuran dehydrogenase subunit C